MTAEYIKQSLLNSIQFLTDYKRDYSRHPETDYTRNRKIPFDKAIAAVLSFRGGTLTNDLLDFFGLDKSIPSSSAFIQQRAKITPVAFEKLFEHFTHSVCSEKLYKGYRLLAVDGSELETAANPDDPESFVSRKDGKKSYNLLHINATYDLLQHLYLDAILQKFRNTDECGALTTMVDRSDIPKALVLADRNYESYNNLAHIQQKNWAFLFRIKDGKTGISAGLALPDSDEFDVPIHLKITNRMTNDVKKLLQIGNCCKYIPRRNRFDFLPKKCDRSDPVQFYELSFRIVRFKISDDSFETIITNLEQQSFPVSELKQLYAMRWGIETSFRDLKYTLGLLHLHSKKVDFVHQEIFAKLTMFNFCQLITQSVVIQQKKKKYAYKVNFSVATHICLQFFLGKVCPPNVEALLMRYISPIRPSRKCSRKIIRNPPASFTYRVA